MGLGEDGERMGMRMRVAGRCGDMGDGGRSREIRRVGHGGLGEGSRRRAGKGTAVVTTLGPEPPGMASSRATRHLK